VIPDPFSQIRPKQSQQDKTVKSCHNSQFRTTQSKKASAVKIGQIGHSIWFQRMVDSSFELAAAGSNTS
jgi:hypothetical protein